jgi:hypothetical protein
VTLQLTMLHIYTKEPLPKMKGPAEVMSLLGTPDEGRRYNVVNIRPIDLARYAFAPPSLN